MLEFVGDAISLSGLTGTKLKCDVIGAYYPFWWGITSGGQAKNFRYTTALVELNAATGEVYVKDTDETVLGSAGHALQLKVSKAPDTSNLRVVLIEEDSKCYAHLKKVIRGRWPSISVKNAEGPIMANDSGIYLLNTSLEDALNAIETIDLGNSIFFFDPLRSVSWTTIEEVAQRRMMKSMYPTGTEFLIFLFTSDWFLGRDDFAPLPQSPLERNWTNDEARTVLDGDNLFGNREWRDQFLTKDSITKKEQLLVEFYKRRLHKWFRYVLPLPFQPKSGQLFHLILCSNFEVGVRMTREQYASLTGNPKYSPDNRAAYRLFTKLYPKTLRNLTGNRRSNEWKALWSIITQHEDGRCDCYCRDLLQIVPDSEELSIVLDWLAKKKYLRLILEDIAWKEKNLPRLYELDWIAVKRNLGIDAPLPLSPLTIANT